MKPKGWVVDMRHYIDEDTGDLPEVISERVLSLAIFFGAIVAWVRDHLPEGDEHTNVPLSAQSRPAAESKSHRAPVGFEGHFAIL